jgi:hypothetical protein
MWSEEQFGVSGVGTDGRYIARRLIFVGEVLMNSKSVSAPAPEVRVAVCGLFGCGRHGPSSYLCDEL